VDKFKNVAVYPVELADGTVVPVGEFVTINADALKDAHNAAHIEEGRLLMESKAEDAAPESESEPEPEPVAPAEEKKGGK